MTSITATAAGVAAVSVTAATAAASFTPTASCQSATTSGNNTDTTVHTETTTVKSVTKRPPRMPIDPSEGITDDGINLTKLLKPTTGKPLLVLIACGSYSPITNMHLLVFEQARNYLMHDMNRYDVIGGFLSPVHDAYGKASLVAQHHRIAMCELAVAQSSWISVLAWETKQKGWTTTAETMCKYQEALNTSHLTEDPIRVKMLCGADLLESTLIPNLWSQEDLDLIFGTFGVVVIERVGLDLAALISSTRLLSKYAHNIDIVPQKITNTISSTAVRELIRKQQSIQYLTPEPVIHYIHEHELFGYNKAAHPKPEYMKAHI